jgi:CRP/FNR family transcriptional regulator, polysaccharide utilization system transcription regulator
MYIKEGFVKIYKEEKCDIATIFKFITSNQFIGLSTIFGKENYQYSCSAIEPTEVLSIDFDVFKDILYENQNFNLHIIESLCEESLYTFNKLAQQSHKHMPGRIADVLLYFSDELFKSDTFTLPVTRKEIAEYSGITSESVIRTFTEFKNDKIIDIIGNDITINSKDILKTLSNNG